MGNLAKNEKKEKQSINYYCKTCGEIPLLHFSNYFFVLICSKHKKINIPIKKINSYISFEYKCSLCKISSLKNNDFYYCYNCSTNYCNKCLDEHNKKEENMSHFSVSILQKNAICTLHYKNYYKYCLNCKLNLCELCEGHNNHYVEYFQDIYPLDEDIQIFNKTVSIILNELYIEDGSRKKKLKKCLSIKIYIFESFSKSTSNYNYINNYNDIIRNTCCQDIYSEMNNEGIYSFTKPDNYLDRINDKNDMSIKIPIKSLSVRKINRESTSSWCMKILNDIEIDENKKLELIAIGGSSRKIIILNLITFKVHQIIEKHKGTVYSLDQYKNNSKYLFSSSIDNTINIYQLNSHYKYDLIQKIQKAKGKSGREIRKVIALSNKLLVSGDYRSITIWKQTSLDENNINYEDFHEIVLEKKTCHLLEVNPSIFIATQYVDDSFQVYKNDEKNFPLIGELKLSSHGSSSNGLSKIDDNIVCSGSKTFIFVVSIIPLQVIQKITMNNKFHNIYYIYSTDDNYLYCRGDFSIYQYRIVKDENDNFIELIKIFDNPVIEGNYDEERAIAPLHDGRIFFVEEINNIDYYQLYA